MLNTLKNRLCQLAIENEAGFAEEVKKRMGRKRIGTHVGDSLNLILLMPHLITRIRDFSDDAVTPAELKHLNGFLLTYLYQPVDFLPDDSHALIGYLDDAYFVGVVYQHLLNYQNQEDIRRGGHPVENISDSLEKVRQVLPRETKLIDQMVEELKGEKYDLFNRMMAGK